MDSESPRPQDPTADLQRVRDFYDSDAIVARFLSPTCFDRLVWHTQFTLRDSRGRTVDETTFLIEWSDLPSTGRVLDFGCGAGALCLTLAARGLEVHGTNISARQIEIARNEAHAIGRSGVSFEICDGRTIPYPDAWFDGVLFQESMCHVPDKAAMFRELHRVLKPGGVMAGQDWFAGASASPRGLDVAPIDRTYQTFLEPAAQYVALARALFTEVQAIDCQELPECTALMRFSGVFWQRIVTGCFTVGFIRGRKAIDPTASA
ncbi:MAG: class I SAM-dependent methyltransferase [Vicinamibacterales bacterium]